LQQKNLRQTPTSLKGKQFRQAVETLLEEQKEAVILAYFGEFTHPELAERTGVPLGTVKSGKTHVQSPLPPTAPHRTQRKAANTLLTTSSAIPDGNRAMGYKAPGPAAIIPTGMVSEKPRTGACQALGVLSPASGRSATAGSGVLRNASHGSTNAAAPLLHPQESGHGSMTISDASLPAYAIIPLKGNKL
jgi:Sigma-70, region 4